MSRWVCILLVLPFGCSNESASNIVADTTSVDVVTLEDTCEKESFAAPCVFDPPLGASCNPYPACNSDGCGCEEICTVVEKEEGITRVQCHAKGTAGLSESCDHNQGPFCSQGTCVDGSCRSFCVGPEDCGGSAACTTMQGVPGNVTVCGPTMEDCDPLDPEGICSAGTACYWQNSGTDCLEVKQAGQQGNACSCPNCCSPGLACVVHEEQEICAAVCSVEGELKNCNELCSGLSVKTLANGLGACVPAPTGTEPPPDAPACDALMQDCLSASNACYPTSSGDQCLAKGSKGIGEPCENVNDCVSGTTCFASKCYGLCDPKDQTNAMCETGFSAVCTPLSGSTAGFCDE